MNVLKTVNLKNLGKKYSGKTRDFYVKDNKRIIISTDRISAFDQNLGYIPYKGHVLNELTAFWFEKTHDIIQNHVIAVPDPNVLVVKNCELIPIEMVVRGYITGVTGTSIWGSYEKGQRLIYGLKFPQGLQKNQKLPSPVITPTTKAVIGHDQRLTRNEIIKTRIIAKEIYEQMEQAALALFEYGTKLCEEQGIILVDTKYEFGLYNGKLMLIDEIHTPDSSRFWIKKTYKNRFENNKEPENFDKEFLRLWFAARGYTGDGIAPRMPATFVQNVSKRYVDIYEKLTEKKLKKYTGDIEKRINDNIRNFQFEIRNFH